MSDDGQQLNTSLFINSRSNWYLDREDVNAVRNGGDYTILYKLQLQTFERVVNSITMDNSLK